MITLFADGSPYRGDISNAFYHADRSCVSVSGLKHLLRSPAHFRTYLDSDRKETPATFLGTAIHTRLLEPHRFVTEYVVAPNLDKRSKAWKDFTAGHAGKQLLTVEQAAMLDGIASNAAAHRSASALLDDGLMEQTLVWQDADTGIWIKIRPDCLAIAPDVGICLDVKSTEDASPTEFVRTSVKYDYDLQAAVYLEGLRVKFRRDFDFAFLAVEKSSPYAVALYGAPMEMIERGQRRFRHALRMLKQSRVSGIWGGYQPAGDLDILDWPRWAS